MKAANLDREAFWAGRFYPRDPQRLQQMVAGMLAPRGELLKAQAVIAPHAGLIYSGAVAGETLSAVELTPTVLILCPKHTRLGEPTSMLTRGRWSFPGGHMDIDEALAAHLFERLPGLSEDPQAHAQEHAIEVLLPFLHALQPSTRFVPLALSYRDYGFCRRFGEALGEALDLWPQPVLLISSSDMNHFEDQETTLRKDRLALEQVLALDARGLHDICRTQDISMCGVVPTTIVLHALGSLTSAELIRHTTSAEVSGDASRVVGYAGVVLA